MRTFATVFTISFSSMVYPSFHLDLRRCAGSVDNGRIVREILDDVEELFEFIHGISLLSFWILVSAQSRMSMRIFAAVFTISFSILFTSFRMAAGELRHLLLSAIALMMVAAAVRAALAIVITSLAFMWFTSFIQ